MAENKYEPKPGRGSAWANDRKTEDWHADYRGKILLPDGTEHWVDVWDATSSSGTQYRSIRIGNPVEATQSQPQPRQATNPAGQTVEIEEFTDDIPF